MKKFLRFSLVALFAVLGMSNAMAEDIIWSEDFSSYSADDVPSGGDYSYACANGKSDTKIYAEALAGGTSPELLIGKKQGSVDGGSFTATIPLNGKSGEMTLTFLTNRNDLKLDVTGATVGDKVRSGNSDTYKLTIASETESITIKFYMTSTSNARLDNIKLYQGTAKQNPGLSWGKASASVTFGDETSYESYLPNLTNPNNLSITCTSSDETVATVTNDGEISVLAVGETTLTASYEGDDSYDSQTVTCVLTVKANKTNAELAFSSEEITITFGETFTAPTLSNPHDAPVVYSSNNTDVAEVDESTGAVTIKAAGTAKITAKVPSTDETYVGSASYTINVNEPAGTDISNTPETAYTVAKAYELIDAGDGLSTEVYVKGFISQIDKFNDDKTITYWISDDGTTTKQFECYHGKGLEEATFTAATDLKIGATVIVKGKLKKYHTTYEFDSGNVLVSYDESTATEETDISNTKETAYTVAKAVELIEAGKGLATEVYVKGIITKVESFNETYHSIAYWISDDGTETSQQFEVYGGLAKEGEEFSSKDDLAVGGKVVVKGILKKFTKGEETIYEMDKNNHLISYEAPATGIQNLTIDTDDNAPMYNLKGERVDANYRGVVIKGGKKTIQK